MKYCQPTVTMSMISVTKANYLYLQVDILLLSNPEVIILDEPTSSLDEKTKTAMKSLLDLFMKDRTVIMVTHDKSILSYADRSIVMKKND